MRRARWILCGLLTLALGGGCASGPILENILPGGLGPAPAAPVIENPIYIPPMSYGKVFDNVLTMLYDEGFEIFESRRYDGHIETFPRVAPGVFLFLKPGSPDPYERVLSTLQTYRHRTSVLIEPAEGGGFFVFVTVRKELEDLARPLRETSGAAIFRTFNPVERQYEVIDPSILERNWIPRGRDAALEQVLLQRLKQCM
jgi:hypothetical protein